jgi:hypothetical protein
MGGAIHPLPQYAFMAWCLVKAQGQLHLFTSCITILVSTLGCVRILEQHSSLLLTNIVEIIILPVFH